MAEKQVLNADDGARGRTTPTGVDQSLAGCQPTDLTNEGLPSPGGEVANLSLPKFQTRADGWIEHDGGPCPVPLDSLVETIWRDGMMLGRCSAVGFTIWPENWTHDCASGQHIIAYRQS